MKEKDSKWDGFGKIEYNFFETVKYAQNQAVIYKHKKRNCSSDAFFAANSAERDYPVNMKVNYKTSF